MPRGKMTQNTGSAKITAQGHTTDGQHGSDPAKRPKGRSSVRELKK